MIKEDLKEDIKLQNVSLESIIKMMIKNEKTGFLFMHFYL